MKKAKIDPYTKPQTVKEQTIGGIKLRLYNLKCALTVKGPSKQWYEDHSSRIDELETLLDWIKSLK